MTRIFTDGYCLAATDNTLFRRATNNLQVPEKGPRVVPATATRCSVKSLLSMP